MRKLLVALVATGLAAAIAPAAQSAAPNEYLIQFPGIANGGPAACGVVCAYWDVPEALNYRPCQNPFPPGSYFDIETVPAPSPPAGKKMILEFEIFPQVDWDSYICAMRPDGGHDGPELGSGTNVLGDPCDNPLGADNPIPAGCTEKATALAEPGKKYVLRAYNWSDPAPCDGVYRFVFI